MIANSREEVLEETLEVLIDDDIDDDFPDEKNEEMAQFIAPMISSPFSYGSWMSLEMVTYFDVLCKWNLTHSESEGGKIGIAEQVIKQIEGEEDEEKIYREIYETFPLHITIRKLRKEIINTYEEILERFEEDGRIPDKFDVEDFSSRWTFIAEWEKIVTFFTVSLNVIERYSISLLKNELIEERYRSSNKTDSLLSRRLSQREREDLLLRCGIINNQLRSDIKQVRNFRNNIIHSPYSTSYPEATDITSEIENCMETIKILIKMESQESDKLIQQIIEQSTFLKSPEEMGE